MSYRLAGLQSSLDKKEEALDSLQASFAMGRLDYRSLQLDPQFDSVRSSLRFQVVKKAMEAKVMELRSAAIAHVEEVTEETK